MDWWPLPYYLGVGYSRTGRYKEALEMLKQALQGNPSSAEIMAELVIVNNALGDEVNAEKYKRKLDILRKDIEQLK
jgi:two-component SAPR family response regulator